MAARLSTVGRTFDSCWLELTSLDMASHGPQKLRHIPVAWSVTVYATQRCTNRFCNMQSQNAIAKCNWTLTGGVSHPPTGRRRTRVKEDSRRSARGLCHLITCHERGMRSGCSIEALSIKAQPFAQIVDTAPRNSARWEQAA